MLNTTVASNVVPTDSQAPTGRRVTLWERISFEAIHTILLGSLYCLSLRGLYRFGRAFGVIEWMINYKRRRRFAAAYQLVLGRKPTGRQRRRAAREYFSQSRCDKLFYLILDGISSNTIKTLLTIEPRSLLDESLAKGRGVYMAMSHHGPHHVAGMLMVLCGYKVAGVRDRQEGGLQRYIQDRFDRRNPAARRMRVLFADGYPREIYRCYREGFIVGSAMDVSRLRSRHQKAESITIFGQEHLFLTGPFRVALRCGAPILQAFIVPEKNFRYRLHIVGKLLDAIEERDESSALTEAVRTYASNVESFLRATPSLLSRL